VKVTNNANHSTLLRNGIITALKSVIGQALGLKKKTNGPFVSSLGLDLIVRDQVSML